MDAYQIPDIGALHNDESFCGLWPQYSLMGRFAAFHPFINLWVASRPLVSLYNGGPLCGPFPTFGKHPEFGEFTLIVLKVLTIQLNFIKSNTFEAEYSLIFIYNATP